MPHVIPWILCHAATFTVSLAGCFYIAVFNCVNIITLALLVKNWEKRGHICIHIRNEFVANARIFFVMRWFIYGRMTARTRNHIRERFREAGKFYKISNLNTRIGRNE